MNYIGLPWKAGAAGPEAFDCWGLVRHWYRTKLGVELPEQLVDAADVLAVARKAKAEQATDKWMELDDEETDCIVALGKNASITHVGVYIGEDYVLHACRATGKCIAQPMGQIRRNWSTVKYYKPQTS